MKNLFLFMLSILLAGGIIGCFDDDDDKCLQAFGELITKEYVFENELEGLEIEVPATIYLTQDEPQRILAQRHENILDKLRFNTGGDILDIEWNVDCVDSSADLEFDMTMKDYKEISVISSGNVYGQNRFDLNDLELNIIGSGNMDLLFDADKIDAQITGSGRLDLEGTTEDFKATITGSGDIRAYDLDAEDVQIVVAGSGNIYVTAIQNLEVTISGSGNVHYRGNPVITVTITGTGRLISEN